MQAFNSAGEEPAAYGRHSRGGTERPHGIEVGYSADRRKNSLGWRLCHVAVALPVILRFVPQGSPLTRRNIVASWG